MKSIRWPATDRDLWLIALLAFVLYFALAVAKPERIFWSLDEGGKWIYMESVLRTGDPAGPLVYPGRWLDSQLEHVALYYYHRQGDELYSWWPVGFPLLTLPFYQLLGWPGLFLLPALAGAASVLLTGMITREVTAQSRFAGLLAAAVTALASPLVFYSTMFWEHTLTAACLLGMVYLMLIARRQSGAWPLLAAGALGSLSVFFRTEGALLVAGITAVYFFVTPWRKTLVLIAGATVVSAAWMVFNLWTMGGLLSPNASSIQQINHFTGFTSAGKKFIPYVLFNAPIVSAFDLGRNLLIIGTLAAGLAFLTGLFQKTRLISAFFLLVVTAVSAYVLLQPGLYRSVHGFVLIFPPVVVASWVWRTEAWKTHRWLWLACCAGIALFATVYFLRAWVAAGGQQWGPRYLLSLYPLLIIAVCAALWDLRKTLGRQALLAVSTAALLAVVVSAGYQARGYHTMHLLMRLYQESGQGIQALGDEVIQTRCIWLPMVIPDLYWQGNVFTKEPVDGWEENVRRSGRDSFWSVEMVACNTTPVTSIYINELADEQKKHPFGIIPEVMTVEQ